MPLKDKLELSGFEEEIFFTDTKRMRTGFLYHKHRQHELLFRENDGRIGSFHVRTGDLTLIYGRDYSLRQTIPLKLYSEADEPNLDYLERKSFLDKKYSQKN